MTETHPTTVVTTNPTLTRDVLLICSSPIEALGGVFERSMIAWKPSHAHAGASPKKASTGATRLGGVSKAASSEVNDLSKLWESAPDVSKFY